MNLRKSWTSSLINGVPLSLFFPRASFEAEKEEVFTSGPGEVDYLDLVPLYRSPELLPSVQEKIGIS